MDAQAERRFSEWAQARAGRLHRTAYLLCGDWYVAEDLVQEALARTALHWARIERVEHPDAYVRTVLLNQARQRWRRRVLWRGDQLRDDAAATDDESATVLERDRLVSALRQLPRGQREVVVLRYFEDLSEAETADLLQCSTGTVKSQTHKAMSSLRRVLDTEATPC